MSVFTCVTNSPPHTMCGGTPALLPVICESSVDPIPTGIARHYIPKVVQQPPPASHQLQQPTPRVMVLLVHLEMVGQIADPVRQESQSGLPENRYPDHVAGIDEQVIFRFLQQSHTSTPSLNPSATFYCLFAHEHLLDGNRRSRVGSGCRHHPTARPPTDGQQTTALVPNSNPPPIGIISFLRLEFPNEYRAPGNSHAVKHAVGRFIADDASR